MTDIVKVQTWDCLLHSKNSIYHHNHEQELFERLTVSKKSIDKNTFYQELAKEDPNSLKNNQPVYTSAIKKVIYASKYVKRLFYFANNELVDPLHIKYMNYEFSLHPGHTRILGKSFNNYFNPISCILYSDANKKLLPTTGLEVLNKLEIIDIPAEEWNGLPIISNYDIIGRYSKKIDSHFKGAEEFWSEHTTNLYRIFFEDMHIFIFPNKANYAFNKRIDVNIEHFSGLREAIEYVFKCVKNDRHT